MIVMKFGGTSVQNEEAINRVISIVSGRLREKPVVVVSALAKVTRLLVQIAESAENGNVDSVRDDLAALRKRHHEVCNALLTGDLLEETIDKVDEFCKGLSLFVEGVCQIGELSPRSRARIISTGELLSSTVVSAAMNARGIKCHWVDARRLIITDDNHLSAKPDFDTTTANVRRIVPREFKGADVVITQGFISSTSEGAPSVLGFEGSDYSAAIFAMALDADKVEIWTDVDGIRTADPRVVESTSKITRVSYEEAAEMSHLGARVLHPMTMGPARRKNIPIMVLNTMNPEGEGSVVAKNDSCLEGPKSVAFLTEIDFLEITSDKVKSSVNMLSEVFNILKSYKLEVSLMSISVSKLSLTFESGQKSLKAAVKELSEIFNVTLYKDKSQISVVGKNVHLYRNLMDDICSCGNIYLMSQGASLMDISVVVDRDRVNEIVNELHNRIFNG